MKTSLHLGYLKQDFWGEFRFLIGKLYNTLFSLSTTYINRWTYRIGGQIWTWPESEGTYDCTTVSVQ